MARTDQSILSEIQYALVEPPDGGANWPSQLWTREEVLLAATTRQGQFLFETLLLVGLANVAVVAGTTLYDLPDDWIRTVLVIWRNTTTGRIRELPRASSFEADHTIKTWELTAATDPLVYFEEETRTKSIQIAPKPSTNGLLEVLYVPNGPDLTGNGEYLTLPDDFAYAEKYGILADLLAKDGRGKDPARAQYCAQRFDLAKTAARLILEGWA